MTRLKCKTSALQQDVHNTNAAFTLQNCISDHILCFDFHIYMVKIVR